MKPVSNPMLQVTNIRFLDEPVMQAEESRSETTLCYAEVDILIPSTVDNNFITGRWRVMLPKGKQTTFEEIRQLTVQTLKDNIL